MTPASGDEEKHADQGRRLLGGATGWLITDGKTGMDVQVQGVSDALGLDAVWKHVSPSGLYKVLAPWGPVSSREGIGEPGSLFAPPWPAVAIATGRASIPYIRRIRSLAGLKTFSVVLQDPKVGAGIADLIWVPAHDRRRGPNVITTLTSPHSFSPERLAFLKAAPPTDIAVLPGPRVAVVLGGKNGVYKFTDGDDDRLERALRALSRLGVSFMVTPSRRTHRRLLAVVEAATEGRPRIIWNGEGTNPYPHFLACADLLVVTADSVNMTGEACATGKPVYVFEPSGGSAKFRRFHQLLQDHGATRRLPESFGSIEAWTYPPLNSAATIAREIERRWCRRRELLSGLCDKTA
jgi:uncharacterized protein